MTNYYIADGVRYDLNPGRTDLDLTYNNLTSLVVVSDELKVLYCYNNKLTILDVNGCGGLEILYCHNNNLSTLDVSGCPLLMKGCIKKDNDTGIVRVKRSNDVYSNLVERDGQSTPNLAGKEENTEINQLKTEIKKLNDKLNILLYDTQEKEEPWETFYKEELLPYFKWKEVLTMMKSINFGWVKQNSTIEDLQALVKRQLESAYKNQSHICCSGGIEASCQLHKGKYYFSVKFVGEQLDNGE